MSKETSPVPVHSHEHALVVVSALNAAGIPATVEESLFRSGYFGVWDATRRPRIMVPPARVAEAMAVIAQAHTLDAAPLYPCPTCHQETKPRGWPLSTSLRLFFTGRFDEMLVPARYCETCDSYDNTPPPEPFTADELGYPPIR